MGRHLLLVQDSIRYNFERRKNVDIIHVSKSKFKKIDKILERQSEIWDSINIFCNGDLNGTNMMLYGRKMSVNPIIMYDDPNIVLLNDILKNIAKYTDTIYIYTCLNGSLDGMKRVCLDVCKENEHVDILLNTNITGSGKGAEWKIEWSSLKGFLEKGEHDSHIYHSNYLFRKRPNISLAVQPVVVKPVAEAAPNMIQRIFMAITNEK
jgi:hypothetical protein